MIRLQTFVKNNGNYTKSQIIKLQEENRILVNGNKEILSFPLNDNDVVTVDGVLLVNVPLKYYLYNKPIGIICTNNENITNNIKSHIQKSNPDIKRLYTIGRLDKDSHGLIILTNDGMLFHKLTQEGKVEKKYLVKVKEKITSDFLLNMEKETLLRGKYTKKTITEKIDDYSFYITLNEGKYRQIRRMVIINHNTVVDLFRVSIGKINIIDYHLPEDKLLEINDLNKYDVDII